VSIDMRQFKKLKMFLHAESLPNEPVLRDDQMVVLFDLVMILLKIFIK
jgi:hypothetical protein